MTSDHKPSTSTTSEARLTIDEEVTLRRVAFGQSELRSLRRGDIAHLYDLHLIQDGRDGPELTVAGRTRFDALPKAASQTGDLAFSNLLREMTKTLAERRR